MPSYAPELNLIRYVAFMKYYWLPFSAYTSFQRLYEAMEQILRGVGTEYTITFQTI